MGIQKVWLTFQNLKSILTYIVQNSDDTHPSDEDVLVMEDVSFDSAKLERQ